MKTYHIHLEDFEADVAVSMNFDTSTVEDAILAGIVEQIAQQIEPATPAPSTPPPAAKSAQEQPAPAAVPAKPVFPPNQLLSEGAVRMETKPAPRQKIN